MVSRICVGGFPDFFNVGFTREMESSLDSIEQGQRGWQDVLKEFYTPFSKALENGDERLQQLFLLHESLVSDTVRLGTEPCKKGLERGAVGVTDRER